MPIQSSDIALLSDGHIDINATLCNLANALIFRLDGNNPTVMQMDFLSIQEQTPLVFKIKFGHHPDSQDIKTFLSKFFLTCGIEHPKFIITASNTETTDVCFSDVKLIMALFKTMEYETLLNNEYICLAHQVDLLQMLLANTVRAIIIDSKISSHPPERIEFDNTGNLSAIVISPTEARYKLNTTNEVCSFLLKYCKLNERVAKRFIALLRQQKLIGLERLARYLDSPNAAGIPLIFAENHWSDVDVCAVQKHLLVTLERRDQFSEKLSLQERFFFKQRLAHHLGASFVVEWLSKMDQYQLKISCSAPDKGWCKTDLDHLATIIGNYQLLSEAQRHAMNFALLLGPSSNVVQTLPESISAILECPILYSLPEGIPTITPSGQTYDFSAISQHLEFASNDPFTKQPLTSERLRPNHLAKQLIDHYKHLLSISEDPDVFPPRLLIDTTTDEFYHNPIVLADGTTASSDAPSAPYRNRCVSDLIAYFQTPGLVPRKEPIERSGIRATIGANLGTICSGNGALSEDAANDEMEIALPYVDYNRLTDTLHIYFSSPEYARHLELGLKRWKAEDGMLLFDARNISRTVVQNTKVIRESTGTEKELMFHAVLSISEESNIKHLLETICKLSPTYLKKLKKLCNSTDIDVLNGITSASMLGDWGLPEIDRLASNKYTSPQRPTHVTTGILSVRADADCRRMTGNTASTPASQAFSSTAYDSPTAADHSSRLFTPPRSAAAEAPTGRAIGRSLPFPDFSNFDDDESSSPDSSEASDRPTFTIKKRRF